MSWLTPLGFLGLAGLIVLIIIYIIKPNYQLKIISSTFVWKLSLKLRKKKLPINKLRNILLFICQVLIISGLAALLAQPFIKTEKEQVYTEKVAIIDASASMLTKSAIDTRFDRAVEEVRNLARETIEAGGRMNIIIAGENAEFAVRDANAEENGIALVNEALDELIDPKKTVCTYADGDIEGAIILADEITSKNSDVEVLLYTDTTYIDSDKIKVMNVSDPLEWNAAILDVRASLVDNYARIEIDVASYGGRDADIKVFCDVKGATVGQDEDKELNLIANARCMSGNVTTLVFGNYDEDTNPDPTIVEDVEINSFESLSVYIQESDSFEYDNSFYLYGAVKKPSLRIQYCSSSPNNFFKTALAVLEDSLKDRWDLDIVELKKDETPELEGFDIYIFENAVPKNMPSDGIVILANPNAVPLEIGLRIGQTRPAQSEALMTAEDHPLLKNVDPSRIQVSMYTEITSYDGYIPLMHCNGSPVVAVKNEPDQKIVVMTFSFKYSNFSMVPDFPLFMNNIFEYFTPPTLTDYVFDANGSITLNSRSEQLDLTGPEIKESFTAFPQQVDLKMPGVYTLTQTPISGNEVVENFYVKIPASESNIGTVEDSLQNPFFFPEENVENYELLTYFALALILLLFAEWWLHSREQF